jgi:hypothetical protein
LRTALIPVLAVVAAIAFLFVPPIHQDPAYHDFADKRTLLGIPNFWNVVSNLPFLFAALWGLRARGDAAWRMFLLGIAAVTFGSAYYHAWPSDATLFWDRLPMTVGFMALFAGLIEDRMSPRAGRLLLIPLLLFGAASILYWRSSGDLRPYALVQFFPMLAIPLMMVLFPARYTDTSGLIALMVFYVFAKVLEWQDHSIADFISTGGHPWKHVAAAIGVFCYMFAVERREPVCYPLSK